MKAAKHHYFPSFVLLLGITLLSGCGEDAKSTYPGVQTRSKPAPAKWAAPEAPLTTPVPASVDAAKKEQYGYIVENSFVVAAQNPLSTFSADVNTASYSNIRRMLTSNQPPPKDAVQIAEMLNYFHYDYPQPKGDDPVSLTVGIAPCPWKAGNLVVRVGVKAVEIHAHDSPPRNLVFLIDTSGSMASPTRLPLVKTAINLLVDQLRPQDHVSIVTYAGDASLKLPPTPGNLKERIRTVVNSLRANGSTNGGGGIRMAYDQARMHYVDGGVNRVILCTDGDFNVGVSNPNDLRRLVEEQRDSHVFLTVLGFGMGNLKNYNLETLANHGNGHYAYIDSESEARKVFVEQGAALMPIAKDVKFQVDFNPFQVGAYRLIGYENRKLDNADFKNDAKDAGDMGSGHTVTALYEIIPAGENLSIPGVDPSKYTKPAEKPTAAAKTGEWLTVRMRYKHPTSFKSQEVRKSLPAEAIQEAVPTDFKFAMAVAQFGMLLRDSTYKGSANFDSILSDAEANLGPDHGNHRAEFLTLVRKAKGLMKAVQNDEIPAAR